MKTTSVTPIPAFEDNYIWCIRQHNNAVVVDPGDATPVLQYLEQHDLTLTSILITHHHWDHTNGIDDLLTAYGQIPVYGPINPAITQITQRLQEGDHIVPAGLDIEFAVLETPGHTLDHIVYHSARGLFCGDTLFSGGCGRLFEGSPAQMHQSLQKLMQLDDNLKVYCTHEYTTANLRFAQMVEPGNAELGAYRDWVAKQRAADKPSLPTTIGQEKAINPFVRVDKTAVRASAQQRADRAQVDEADVFATIRDWKDNA